MVPTLNQPLSFGFVHGAWQGAWCWDLVRDELGSLGHQSVALDLPIDDPDANFDDYANVVVKALKGYENIVLIGHSRAGNVIPRTAGKLSIRRLVFLSSGILPETIGHPTPQELGVIPAKNTAEFSRGITMLPNNMTIVAPEFAKKFLYHDCTPEIQEWAISQLRPQRNPINEPRLAAWPDVPSAYILCTEDRVVNPDWSRYAAENWLHIKPHELPGGHSPFLSRPKELAALLVSIAG